MTYLRSLRRSSRISNQLLLLVFTHWCYLASGHANVVRKNVWRTRAPRSMVECRLPPCTQISKNPSILPTLLSTSGGSSKKKHSRKKRRKRSRRSSVQQHETRRDRDVDHHHQELPTIKAILVPRLVSLSVVVKWVSIAVLCVSMLFCIQTAGIPYARAVLALVNNPKQETTMTVKPIQEFLAKRIASAKNDILPPRYLPLPLPLLGVLVSLGIWVCLTVLFPRWFVPVNVFMKYKQWDLDGNDMKTKDRITKLSMSRRDTRVLVRVPREQRDFVSDGKAHVIRPLHKSESETKEEGEDDATFHDHPHEYYFELNHQRLYCDPFQTDRESKVTDGSPILHSHTPLRQLLSPSVTLGLCSKSKLQLATERFGPYSSLELPTPTVSSAFIERISSPLVALQILGRLLSALEENLLRSVSDLAQTLLHHYSNARRSIVSAQELAQEVKGNVEDTAAMSVWAVRPKQQHKRKKRGEKHGNRHSVEWVEIHAADLLPGDVFVLGHVDRGVVMPVDALLLEGNCVANEAVLTGETVPQSKTPIDMDDATSTETLDMMSKHRNSVLFAGTSLIHCTHQDEKHVESDEHPPFPSALSSQGASHAKLLALRTGSYSSRGEMMRALAKSRGHVGAVSNRQTERDAIRLIASLSMFALMACASLFVEIPFLSRNRDATKKKKTHASPFRRVIQCTRIVVASVPSDIPLALSGIAHDCSIRLKNTADVVCSEPGSLLTSSQVDVVVFDKTGTLTADTQSLSSIVPPPDGEKKESHPMADAVLAGCHSLVNIDEAGPDEGSEITREQLVGDPLDLASFKYSGWAYDSRHDCYTNFATNGKTAFGVSPPVMLWQIRTFPFDPNRRTSSAVILVLHQDSQFRLWKVVKGSPDVMSKVVTVDDYKEEPFESWFDRENRILGAQGMRAIVLAAKDMTGDSAYVKSLFPSGLPQPIIPAALSVNQNQAHHILSDTIETARFAARALHRNEIEGIDDVNDHKRKLSFVGFASFDASIRPSTERVIHEIRNGGVKVLMLTGDSVDAALSVGGKAGLIDSRSIAFVDAERNSSSLVLKTLKLPSKKMLKRGRGIRTVNTRRLSSKRIEQTLQQVQIGESTLILTGNAFESLLRHHRKDSSYKSLLNNLSQVSMIARATPRVKRSVVSCLRNRCGNTVLMCGDGVNDVAAMKSADVSVALLNGYGDESTTTDMNLDVEDDRRRQKVSKLRIGSNRKLRMHGSPQRSEFEEAGIGNSRVASLARFRAHVAEDLRGTDSSFTKTLAAIGSALKKENERRISIEKGGGAAARILAEEDKLRKSILKKTDTKTDQVTVGSGVESDTSVIKPGEASLAAAFSCLRPAIDGVDAIVRAGIAAAAWGIETQQRIALECIMACYNLATLYRDGFRSGNKMWSAELTILTLISSASMVSSSRPRPRLSHSRPISSMLHPSSSLSICAQAAIHLVTLNAGVKVAHALESIYSEQNKKMHSRIRWMGAEKSGVAPGSPIALVLDSLTTSSFPQEEEQQSRNLLNIFGRPPFLPNYTTNLVFLLSIFQRTVSSVVNHSGEPFNGSIIENRPFCLAVGGSILFVVACVCETFPMLNASLELRHIPDRKFRLRVLVLFLTNFVACYAADKICSAVLNHETGQKYKQRKVKTDNAADEEESLWSEESIQNKRLLLGIAAITLKLVLDLIT